VNPTQNQWVDVNGNGILDPLDVLGIIDYLNQSTWGLSESNGGEGESRNMVNDDRLPPMEELNDESIKLQLQNYLTNDLNSLTDEEIAERLSIFIDFGSDEENEDFWR
jgi:hypothetical protein